MTTEQRAQFIADLNTTFRLWAQLNGTIAADKRFDKKVKILLKQAFGGDPTQEELKSVK